MQDHLDHTSINPIQTLPSGAIVEIVEWSVGDLAGMGARGKGANLDQMISRCKMHEDPLGIYDMEPGKSLNAEKLQTGDRGTAILLQRVVTHWKQFGPFFDFTFRCEDADCADANKSKINWSVDLRRFLLSAEDFDSMITLSDGDELEDYQDVPVLVDEGKSVLWHDRFGSLPIQIGSDEGIDNTVFMQNLSGSALKTWKAGNRFDFNDPVSGKKVVWKIQTGADENALIRFRKDTERFQLEALGRRIAEIEGIASYQKAVWIKDWGAGGSSALQEEIHEIEPGYFKEFDVCCPRCGEEQEIEFPLDMTFFSPSSRKRKRGSGSRNR